ncbi:DUF397 domain-containing protein [Streptomyces flavidovirens]|uniref:DUF397 domain-containing protein n=1 Tax=Streptomyces flavidovirens TaxID=67298 RepID=UPI00369B8C61
MATVDLYEMDLTHMSWRKSSYSMANNDCVEVAHLSGGAVALRDSMNLDLNPLRFTAAAWLAFRHDVEANETRPVKHRPLSHP